MPGCALGLGPLGVWVASHSPDTYRVPAGVLAHTMYEQTKSLALCGGVDICGLWGPQTLLRLGEGWCAST